jgi:hypothetical protein
LIGKELLEPEVDTFNDVFDARLVLILFLTLLIDVRLSFLIVDAFVVVADSFASSINIIQKSGGRKERVIFYLLHIKKKIKKPFYYYLKVVVAMVESVFYSTPHVLMPLL